MSSVIAAAYLAKVIVAGVTSAIALVVIAGRAVREKYLDWKCSR